MIVLIYLLVGVIFGAIIEKVSRKGDTDYVAFFFLAAFWPFVIMLFLFFYVKDLRSNDRGGNDSEL
jgi:hypothetical protein